MTQVRRLNEPARARVGLGVDGRPSHITWYPHSSPRRARRDRVEHVVEVWYVDDGWWNDHPIRRMYFACQMRGGARLVALYDLTTEHWSVQR
jgi:hypothetical protein